MSPARSSLLPFVTALLLAPSLAHAQEAGTDSTAVESVVRNFHAALKAGDANAATAILAPDAVVLEGGDLETRQEYLDHHLQADIAFAQAVASRYDRLDVTLNGDTAWVNATTRTEGAYQGKPLSLVGAESMVLSRTPSGWQIRAIHWSARKANKPD